MTRCTFKQGQYHCGSYAFNLWKEGIEQGEYCDHHYWQDQAEKARADEREAFPNLEPVITWLENGCDPKEAAKELRIYAAAIRARGQA